MSEEVLSKRQQNTQKNRDTILAAAQKLFRELGYDRTTMADIQRETGLSNGTIYHLFHNKHDILRSVYEQYTHTVERLSDNMEMKLDDPVKEIMHFLLQYESQFTSMGKAICAALYQRHLQEGFKKDNMSPQTKGDSFPPYGWTLRRELLAYLTEIDKLGKLREGLVPKIAMECIYTFARGSMFTWTFSKEDYDLIEKSTPLWEAFLPNFFV